MSVSVGFHATDEKAEPSNLKIGFDLWENDTDQSLLRVNFDENGNSIKTDGDTLTGYTWQAKYEAGKFHNNAETKIEQYSENTEVRDADVGYFFRNNMVLNGDFESSENWVVSPPWIIEDGKANYDGTGVAYRYLRQDIGLVAGKTYNVKLTYTKLSGGVFYVKLGDGASAGYTESEEIDINILCGAGANENFIRFFCSSDTICNIDNVEVYDVAISFDPKKDYSDKMYDVFDGDERNKIFSNAGDDWKDILVYSEAQTDNVLKKINKFINKPS